jgi:hypothetical protein
MEFREQSFAAALEVASECDTAWVVHAWIPGGPGFVVHAWAEVDDAVYDLTESNHPFPKTQYYARMGVRDEWLRRYDRVTFFTLVAEKGGFGPFDPAFLPLTSPHAPLLASIPASD